MNDIRITEDNIISDRDLIIAKEIIQYAAEAFILDEFNLVAKGKLEPDYFNLNELCMLIALKVFDRAKEDNVDTSSCSSFLAIVMEVRNHVKKVVTNHLLSNF